MHVQLHVLPQEMLGRSTFGVSMWLLKWLPMRVVDLFLLVISRLMIGDTNHLGLIRPKLGPLHLKTISGKTPVLDVGTLAKIRTGHIKVYHYPPPHPTHIYMRTYIHGRLQCKGSYANQTFNHNFLLPNVPSYLLVIEKCH